jgi:hypothetical protein
MQFSLCYGGIFVLREEKHLTRVYNKAVMKQIISTYMDWFTFRRWAAVPVRVRK